MIIATAGIDQLRILSHAVRTLTFALIPEQGLIPGKKKVLQKRYFVLKRLQLSATESL